MERADRAKLPISSEARRRGRIFRLAGSRSRVVYIPEIAYGRVTDYPAMGRRGDA